MSIKISYKKGIQEKLVKNYVLFANEDFRINGLNKLPLGKQSSQINKIIKSNYSKKKEFIFFNHNLDQKIVLIKIKNNQTSTENEKKGANFYNFVKSNILKNLTFFDVNIFETQNKNKNFIDEFLHGIQIKSYEFNKYKTKRENSDININICFRKKIPNKLKNNRFNSLLEGTNFTKDLVSEPGNILHPDEYSKRILKLKKIGLKIKAYNKNELKKMGMGALLGVGQGSVRGSYLVTMEWNGIKTKTKPLAFVGKGVCFDTGGYSLKPARFMEDMTYDMAGSAAVVGLMKTLALRKAKINAVGVVGLVENMVSGNAQRPGDIVKSYSGKTIEVLNTDAEGRLVLADALTFTEKKYKPKFIIDLATLTGAIIVSLGSEYGGLFSNDDKLSKQLIQAGEKVDEKLWRMPLHKNFDKLMDSKNADMQNINYVGGAGSTTAAQFLQRFILNKTPWAHLDIAGMAFSKYGGALNSGGATGFGVRLLNKLIEDSYE